MDNKAPQTQLPIEKRRAYRKPLVQIYGTLKDMTRATTQVNTTHVQDNPAPFPPSAQLPNNRT